MPSQLPLSLSVPLAAVLGGLSVLAFAPFSLFPVAILSLALLYELLAKTSTRGGFLIGWAFGIGLMGFGIFWIRISLNEYGNMAPWLAYLMTVLLMLSMALYYGMVGALASWLDAGSRWRGPLLAFPALWVLGEWLRGWLFTGFPWLAFGYTQVDSPLAGFAPIIGVYGISLVVTLCAGLLRVLFRWTGSARYATLAGILVVWLGGVLLGRIDWTRPNGEELSATIIQANIPQTLKWDPDTRLPTLRAYLELTRDNWGSDLIVWPETAIPDLLHQIREPLIEPLAEDAREHGSELVIGVPVLDTESRAYYNGLLSLGTSEDLYLKRHLVPFGEFIPFKRWLGPIAEAFEVPMSDFSSGQAPRPLLQVGQHAAGVSICYEDVFPEEVSQALPKASYLINVSNDAWFGDSLAPHQHLEMARMRALENERWMVRSTNTGISAIIDHTGTVVGDLPAFERGAFTGQLQPRQGATPFVILGNYAAIGAAAAMLLIALLSGRRRLGFRRDG